MAYADIIRSAFPTMEDIADLIEGIASADMPTIYSTYTPTWSAKGSMTFTSVTTDRAQYVRIGKVCWVYIKGRGTIGGTLNNEIYVTLPFARTSSTPALEIPAISVDSAGGNGYAFTGGGSTTLLTFIKLGAINFSAGAGTFAANFHYEVA